MLKGLSAVAAGGLVLGLLAVAPMANAAEQGNMPTQQGNTAGQQGSTTGPAAGSNVAPSTAVQKENGNKPGVAVGAPGMAGQPGNKSGPPPKHHARTHHKHMRSSSTASKSQ